MFDRLLSPVAVTQRVLGGVAMLGVFGLLGASVGSVHAQSAHFWFDTVASGTAGPGAPAVALAFNGTTTLYLWGRPTPGRQMRAMSLDVVTNTSGIDFVDGSYTLYNGVDVGSDRFEYVRDSSSVPDLESEFSAAEVIAGDADELLGINGFTLTSASSVRGFGPVCTTGEDDCEIAGDGEAAWLLAAIDVSAVLGGKSVELDLSVGERGLVERTLAAGDYDLDGTVDAADHTAWASAYGTTAPAADGTGDGTVDAADYTVWRDQEGDSAVLGGVGDTSAWFGLEPDMSVADATITLGAAPAMATPEPKSWSVAVVAVVSAAGSASGRRRRNRPIRFAG